MSQDSSLGQSVNYRLRPALTNAELNALFSSGWPAWQTAADSSHWQAVLAHSLVYIGAYAGEVLVGFVNVAWDGRDHAFLLDPRVHPDYRNRGIGTELVRRARAAAAEAGCEWLHVDYAPELTRFYAAVGFEPTSAGLIRLTRGQEALAAEAAAAVARPVVAPDVFSAFFFASAFFLALRCFAQATRLRLFIKG